ncbi:Pimeloyl-ACP methyl ester carboxylesterase [Fodinibius roseus]|uniref:Pimeloyl-ACP methyl ester carboxylesterase n=1 Tax=Fodinibius roseus TaxID=1194090 RepID=A0A1M5DAC8_9BACT|nr:alpha/beta hydrolase [Fodinibius roseus]SHF63946.1 Pimeloyl-ACP methyl ester carboxylesterase [Fodinibius roseus]
MFGTSDFKVHEKNGFEYLHISTEASNAQNLILLHGMFGGLSNYDPLLKQIQGYNIFVPKIPIYELGMREISISRLTKWLRSFCEALDIKNPVLLGNSMGGHLALDYAQKYQDDIAALVLTGSSGLLEKDFGSTFPRRKDRDFIRKQANLTFYEDLIDDTVMDEIMTVVKSPSKLTNLLALTRDTHSYNMEEHLPKIKQKVLLVWGRQDEITPPKVAHMFLDKLPDAELHWIDKCGHAPMMEHPEKFASLLKDFLIQLESNANSPKSHYEKDHPHL